MARLKGSDSCAEVVHESLLRETVTRFLDEVRIGGREFGGYGLSAFLMRGMRKE
jgi:hypothetical protein